MDAESAIWCYIKRSTSDVQNPHVNLMCFLLLSETITCYTKNPSKEREIREKPNKRRSSIYYTTATLLKQRSLSIVTQMGEVRLLSYTKIIFSISILINLSLSFSQQLFALKTNYTIVLGSCIFSLTFVIFCNVCSVMVASLSIW